MEKTAASIEALTALYDTGSSDSKASLDAIAGKIETLNNDGLKSITTGLTSMESEMRIGMSDISKATGDSLGALSAAIR